MRDEGIPASAKISASATDISTSSLVHRKVPSGGVAYSTDDTSAADVEKGTKQYSSGMTENSTKAMKDHIDAAPASSSFAKALSGVGSSFLGFFSSSSRQHAYSTVSQTGSTNKGQISSSYGSSGGSSAPDNRLIRVKPTDRLPHTHNDSLVVGREDEDTDIEKGLSSGK